MTLHVRFLRSAKCGPAASQWRVHWRVHWPRCLELLCILYVAISSSHLFSWLAAENMAECYLSVENVFHGGEALHV